MNKNTSSQYIVTIAILVALFTIILLFVNHKIIKPKLEEMYKEAIEMIE